MGNADRLNRKADKALAKVRRTGNGSHLARAAELRARARERDRKTGRK